jgi:hypothetical protein
MGLLSRLLAAPLWLGLAASGVQAQSVDLHSSTRAVNMARNVAVQLNGGLGVYQPAKCMFDGSSGENPCLIQRGPDGYIFRFLGGSPGWQQLNQPPTLETQIRIAVDGRSVLGIDYNGAPR